MPRNRAGGTSRRLECAGAVRIPDASQRQKRPWMPRPVPFCRLVAHPGCRESPRAVLLRGSAVDTGVLSGVPVERPGRHTVAPALRQAELVDQCAFMVQGDGKVSPVKCVTRRLARLRIRCLYGEGATRAYEARQEPPRAHARVRGSARARPRHPRAAVAHRPRARRGPTSRPRPFPATPPACRPGPPPAGASPPRPAPGPSPRPAVRRRAAAPSTGTARSSSRPVRPR